MYTKPVVVQSLSSWLPQTETWIYTQLKHLPADVKAHVVCERVESLAQFPWHSIHCFADSPWWRRLYDRVLRKLRIRRYLSFSVKCAQGLGANVLHSHFGNTAWANIGLSRRAGLKHIATFYGLDVNYLPKQDPRWLDRYAQLFDQVELVLCEGEHMAKCVLNLGCPPSKVCVHHLGVDLAGIRFVPRLWHPGSPLRVLLSASFREKKGLPYALEALGRFQKEVPLQITILGDASAEPRSQREKQRILKTIDHYSLSSKVRMLGYQPHAEMLKEAYEHDVFLSPSVTASDGDTEGGAPVTIIEMAATGIPVISTIHCDIPGVVVHGKTGLLAEERDVGGLISHLGWLVNNPDRWADMVLAARTHMELEFDAKVQGQRLGAIYRAILNQ